MFSKDETNNSIRRTAYFRPLGAHTEREQYCNSIDHDRLACQRHKQGFNSGANLYLGNGKIDVDEAPEAICSETSASLSEGLSDRGAQGVYRTDGKVPAIGVHNVGMVCHLNTQPRSGIAVGLPIR
ncbi:hypothetical protein AB664_34700 [Brucella anthropi]|uniref:Uncharacterized protein n=1 Tax=Brucella anthropi TaxID=529 RepID=A0A656Z4Y0_BRUAN|nr:hypothetical protein AB664_34700 [Brucella anthropi]